ncbi:putative non-specific serine/threonine protein kinase [Dioscorea sansibarensis]
MDRRPLPERLRRRLRLESLGLSGKLNPVPLKQLPGLRAISLAGNSLSGSLPDSLSDLTALRALYLQANHFSGPITPNLFSKMTRLRKLYLAGNHFSGAIPISISQAKSLVILYLEGNEFSGSIPDLGSLKALKSFNVSHNALEGRIPASAAKFGASAFASNPGLCGEPLVNKPCDAPTLVPGTSTGTGRPISHHAKPSSPPQPLSPERQTRRML